MKRLMTIVTLFVVISTAVTTFAVTDDEEVSSISGQELCDYATSDQFIGLPYVWGGTTTAGFDCSGFVQYVYKHFGIEISRTTYTQKNDGITVSSIENLQLGDLVFFYSYDHVGIYIGNDEFVHSSNTGIIISSLSDGYYSDKYCGATRIL